MSYPPLYRLDEGENSITSKQKLFLFSGLDTKIINKYEKKLENFRTDPFLLDYFVNNQLEHYFDANPAQKEKLRTTVNKYGIPRVFNEATQHFDDEFLLLGLSIVKIPKGEYYTVQIDSNGFERIYALGKKVYMA